MILVVGAVIAGFIDSICGGGGLISIPVLLMAGFNPTQTIAANKLQGTLGALASTHYYLGKGIIKPKILQSLGLSAMLGGMLGTCFVYLVGNNFMEMLLPFMLIVMVFYFTFSQQVADHQKKSILGLSTLACTIIPAIGFYDGFFGPSAGTLYLTTLISLAGMAVTHAVAYSRVLNLISNATSLLLFILLGKMAWAAGIAMSVGEVIGVYLGSHLVHKNGARLVRPLVIVVCIGMLVKILLP
jgi:hypothetical protein